MVELADTLVSGTSEPTLMGVQVPLRARASKSEQCAGFASVSYERKTARPFFSSRLKRANPSSAEKSRASPMKEKRCRRFSASDFFVNYIFKFLDTLIAIKKYSGLNSL